jgi:hypothetical protein
VLRFLIVYTIETKFIMKNSRPILAGVVIVLAVIGVLFLLKTFLGTSKDETVQVPPQEQTPPTVQTATISGTIQYSGIKPQTGKEGFVYFEYREHNAGEFKKLEGYTVPLADNQPWNVDGVPVGKLLDARAVIQLNDGQKLATSNTISVSAPAKGEVFDFNVTLDMIPNYILEKNPVSLSGTVTINGYIPSGATLTMFAKAPTDTDFKSVVNKTPITGSVTNWSWNGAVAGTLYQLKTEAYQSNGSVFASSNVGEKAAPSSNASFVITSRATDPNAQTSANISGTVKINGNYSNNAKVKIKTRVTGTDEYTTVATVSPSNDPVSWSWADAISGKQYDIKPFIVEEGQEDIPGNKVVTAAPASGVKLTLDTKSALAVPNNKPELISCTSVGDNKYNAQLKYKNIDGAVKYNLQVGKSEGSADVNDSIVNNSSNNDPTLISTINKGQDYYSRYSYTDCGDCGKDSYSEYSPSLKFKCE